MRSTLKNICYSEITVIIEEHDSAHPTSFFEFDVVFESLETDGSSSKIKLSGIAGESESGHSGTTCLETD